MNISPQDLLNLLNSGNEAQQKNTAQKMLSGMDNQQAKQIKSIMQDEEKLKNILSSPQAQELLKKLKGNKNG